MVAVKGRQGIFRNEEDIKEEFEGNILSIKEAIEKAEKGWSLAQEIISSGEYDLVVLDEFTYPLHYGWLDTKKVLSWIEENKPESMHLIITGRYAPEELIEMADMVNEVTSIKHPFDKGIKAQIGIEY